MRFGYAEYVRDSETDAEMTETEFARLAVDTIFAEDALLAVGGGPDGAFPPDSGGLAGAPQMRGATYTEAPDGVPEMQQAPQRPQPQRPAPQPQRQRVAPASAQQRQEGCPQCGGPLGPVRTTKDGKWRYRDCTSGCLNDAGTYPLSVKA